ncbi:MAG: hypothetical protein KJP23_08250 [Deltaproteobacteria bacterium]|nr:hypothetical protein [Deltaproteobacteria bacterium]
MMDDIALYMGIGLLVLGGLAVQFTVTRRRHRRDHRKDLEPILAKHGLTFVSARWPGIFKVGPFPRVEIEIGRPQSRVGGIRGEYDAYRIVTVHDAKRNNYKLWAKLEFELFGLRRIRWRAEKSHHLPPEAGEMLEG